MDASQPMPRMERLAALMLALLCACALALFVTGCAGANDTAATDDAAAAEAASDADTADADTSDTDTTESTADDTDTPAYSGTLTEPIEGDYASGIHHATIEVENYGTIKLELNATNAPITVSNFAELASNGFYDGLTFHRIIDGFMIQGGDPNGDGTGGSGRNIKGEFFANGVTNAIQHKRGVVSMARASDYDSGSSQFFIMVADNDSLDQQYAAFGKVTEGMDVVDAIAKVPVEDDNGTVAPDNQPIITSIVMDD